MPATALALQFEHNLAVVVGINAYAHVRPLQTARSDAERMASLLADARRDSHDRYTVISLYDETASVEALGELLFTILPEQVQAAGQRTRVPFYFAGHGDAEDSDEGLKGFLFPQNANPEDEATLLPMGKVQDALASLPCQHVLMILDCCSAGALPMPQRTRSVLRPPPLYWDYLERYVDRKARQVITSAAHNQQALDIPHHKLGVRDAKEHPDHSPFAQALFEALDPAREADGLVRDAGRNGVVTATELYLYISEALQRRVGSEQTAGLWTVAEKGHDQGEFVFLLPGVQVKLEEAPDLTKAEYNPWPGLRSYGPEEAELFAGRDQEIQELAQLLDVQPLVVITGSSAAGKSSLVQAGLLPWLADRDRAQPDEGGRQWRVLPLLALGPTLPAGWDRLLGAHFKEALAPTENGGMLHDSQDPPDLAAAWVKAHPDQRLLLPLEAEKSLFDQVAPEELVQLWPLLAEMAQRDVLHVLLTLRSDHWLVAGARQGEAQTPFLPSATRYELKPMKRDALRQTIEQPAAARMVYLESETLVDGLLDAVEGEPAALPLLSLTLRHMYLRYAEDARNGLRGDRTLTQAHHDAVGGVEGITVSMMEALYNGQPDDFHRHAQKLTLMRLVDVEKGQYEHRKAACREFTYPHQEVTVCARTTIAGLAACGLAVIDADKQGDACAELGHIALVELWPRLRAWLLDYSAEWGLQRELTGQVGRYMLSEQLADLWDDDARLPQLQQMLWPAGGMREGIGWPFHWIKHSLIPQTATPQNTKWLNATELEFVQTSILRRAATLRRILGISLAVLVVIGVLLSFGLYSQRQAATERALRAETERLRRQILASNLASEAKTEISKAAPNPSLALLLAEEAISATWQTDGYVHSDALSGIVDVIGQAPPVRLTLPRQGGGKPVTCATYGPDGESVIAASTEGDVNIWNVTTGQLRRTLRGHEGRVRDAAYSPDGKSIVTAGADRTARIWDAASGKRLLILRGHTEALTSTAYSPNGDRIVTASADGSARIWDSVAGTEIFSVTVKAGPVNSAAFSPDGQSIVTADDSRIRVWDVGAGELRCILMGRWWDHAGPYLDAAFSPDGTTIASGSGMGTGVLWDATLCTPRVVLNDHIDAVNSVAYAPSGTSVLTASNDGTAKVWGINGKPRITLSGHTGPVHCAEFSPDNQSIVTSSDDGTIKVWGTAYEPGRLLLGSGHSGTIFSTAYSPDGDTIVTARLSGTVTLWDADTGQELRSFVHPGGIYQVVWTPDHKAIITAGHDHQAIVWNAFTGMPLGLPLRHEDEVLAVASSPDGISIATAGRDRVAKIWDAATGQLRLQLEGHTRAVTHVDFSPDGRAIITTSDDMTAKVWNAATGLPTLTLRGHLGPVLTAAFSPSCENVPGLNGERCVDLILTASYDMTARIWNATTGEELLVLRGHRSSVPSAVFSPDGKSIVTASFDKTAKVWDATTGQDRFTLRGHTGYVYAAAFSPDGESIVTASQDGSARVWPATPSGWIELANQFIQRNPPVLAEEEKQQYGIP